MLYDTIFVSHGLSSTVPLIAHIILLLFLFFSSSSFSSSLCCVAISLHLRLALFMWTYLLYTADSESRARFVSLALPHHLNFSFPIVSPRCCLFFPFHSGTPLLAAASARVTNEFRCAVSSILSHFSHFGSPPFPSPRAVWLALARSLSAGRVARTPIEC